MLNYKKIKLIFGLQLLFMSTLTVANNVDTTPSVPPSTPPSAQNIDIQSNATSSNQKITNEDLGRINQEINQLYNVQSNPMVNDTQKNLINEQGKMIIMLLEEQQRLKQGQQVINQDNSDMSNYYDNNFEPARVKVKVLKNN